MALTVTLLLMACGSREPVTEPSAAPTTTNPVGRSIRLGDVDPDTPARRMRHLAPLVGYLVEQLRDVGITRGEVVIARSLEEMARMLREGEVDLYLDSAYPALLVQERSGSEILLRRWVKGAANYWSVFMTSREAGITSLDDLRGSLVAFQERYSTSGFVLPAGTLIEQGFELELVGGPESRLQAGAINYFFSRDEENTVELVVSGRVPAGAISNQDWAEMPAATRSQLRIIGRTTAMPRQLLSVRADLEPRLVSRIRDVLLQLAGPQGASVVLEDSPYAWTWKFDAVTGETATEMQRLTRLIRLLGLE